MKKKKRANYDHNDKHTSFIELDEKDLKDICGGNQQRNCLVCGLKGIISDLFN